MTTYVQVETALLPALQCFPADFPCSVFVHPHRMSSGSYTESMDCGISLLSRCCLHITGLPDYIHVCLFVMCNYNPVACAHMCV